MPSVVCDFLVSVCVNVTYLGLSLDFCSRDPLQLHAHACACLCVCVCVCVCVTSGTLWVAVAHLWPCRCVWVIVLGCCGFVCAFNIPVMLLGGGGDLKL